MALEGEEWLHSSEKRAMDIALTGALLPIGVPATLIAASAIRVADGQSPSFSHERMGADGECFAIYKLRTMPPKVANSVASKGGHNDPNATELGRFLRRVRLDEVPQVLNILSGDMSVVGPRPLVPSQYWDIYNSRENPDPEGWRHARAVALPGMLDSYGLKLYRDGQELGVTDRVRADIEYAATASFVGDSKIILGSFGLLAPQEHEYRRGSKILGDAAKGFGIGIGEQDQAYWHSVFRMTRELDRMVDRDGLDDTGPIIDDLFRGEHPDIDENVLREFASSMRHTTIYRREVVKSAFLQIPNFAAEKRFATTPRQFTEICRAEAACFAGVLALDPADFPEEERARVRLFNEWLQRVAIVGQMLDAAVDMPQDYRDGNIGIRPRFSTQLRLGLAGVEHSLSVLRRSIPALGLRLGSAALACIRDRKS